MLTAYVNAQMVSNLFIFCRLVFNLLNKGITMAHVQHNSGKDDWCTPPLIVDAVREVLEYIDLDPASCAVDNTIVQASTYYTVEEDGLSKQWNGHVFMNPPYGAIISKFTTKFILAFENGDISEGVVLTNNATETRWGYGLLSASSCVCFLRGRVKFLSGDLKPVRSPLQGQMVTYFGSNVDLFKMIFGKIGVCFEQ